MKFYLIQKIDQEYFKENYSAQKSTKGGFKNFIQHKNAKK